MRSRVGAKAQDPDSGAKIVSFKNFFKNFFKIFFTIFFKNFFRNCFGIL